jgi:hypothetical protein
MIQYGRDAVKRISWVLITGLALACGVALPGECSAQARCPWLNAATAAGVLGGDVQMAVTTPVEPVATKGVGAASYSDQLRTDRFDVSCDFSRKEPSGVSTLSIVVKTMSDPAKDYASFLAQCAGPTETLKGIGNEAVQCVMKDSSHAGYEQVIARVRDRAFVLTVSRATTATPGGSGDGLHDDTRNIAEQIAGSLF